MPMRSLLFTMCGCCAAINTVQFCFIGSSSICIAFWCCFFSFSHLYFMQMNTFYRAKCKHSERNAARSSSPCAFIQCINKNIYCFCRHLNVALFFVSIKKGCILWMSKINTILRLNVKKENSFGMEVACSFKKSLEILTSYREIERENHGTDILNMLICWIRFWCWTAFSCAYVCRQFRAVSLIL